MNRTIAVNNPGKLTIGGNIGQSGGSGGLIKGNGGTLILTGANSSYTGLTQISNGTLVISKIANFSSNSSVGAAASGDINLGINTNTATLEYAGAGDSNDRAFRVGDTTAANASTGVIKNNGTGALTFTAKNFNSTVSGITVARTLTLGGSYTTAANEIQGATQNNDAATGGLLNVIKADAGTWILSGNNTYTGTTTVSGGSLIVDGNISTSTLTTVQTGATLGGSGTVGALTIDSGGFFSPGNSPGIMTVDGDYTQNGTLVSEITGLTAGTQHDQVVVNGTVSLNGALSLSSFTGFTPVNGDLIFILLNDGVDAIAGTFTGLAQGAVVGNYLGFDWQISYTANSGGNSFTGGNDVALMAVPEPGTAMLGGLCLFMFFRRRPALC